MGGPNLRLPEDLLDRSAEEAARRIALAFLTEARRAVPRLDDAQDAEALHDFRVAIRRLRSTLRAWRKHLGDAVRKKDLERLRGLQRATGAGRDAEVLLEMLEPHRDALRTQQQVGLEWLVGNLRDRKDEAYAHVRDDVVARFGKMEPGLRRSLEKMTVEIDLAHSEAKTTFAEAAAREMRRAARKLFDDLAEVGSIADQEEAHEARIAGKRLRYLLEPIRPHAPRAAEIVSRLKRLQDLLGELHDCAVLIGELGRAAEEAAAHRARKMHELARDEGTGEVLRREAMRDERPGLIELTKRVNERMRKVFEELERHWLKGRAEILCEAVEELAADLEHRARRDREIERKYLLSGVPDVAREHPVVEIEQGYLPGGRLRERIRRVHHDEGVDYKRTVKLGRGIERFELDEPTTSEVFDAMWPLTEGARVLKRRYEVPHDGLVWEIDEFTDRELYLAEVELPAADITPTIPDWLEPYVVREVTDEPGYVNVKLAK